MNALTSRFRSAFVCGMVILALTGCAGATASPSVEAATSVRATPEVTASPSPTATATPTASPSATPTASPSPTPTPDLVAVGETYSAAVDAANEIVCDAVARIEAAPQDLAVLTQAYRDIASADRLLADSLRDGAFPPDVQPLIDEMIALLAASEAAFIQAGSASTIVEFNTVLQRALDANAATSAQSNLIRGTLGLASVAAC